jgi:hypothetical protein
MLAFVEHFYLSCLCEIWHRSMVCRLEDICCNWEFPLHISHGDFGTDKWSVDGRLAPCQEDLLVHTPMILLRRLFELALGSDFVHSMSRAMASILLIQSRNT